MGYIYLITNLINSKKYVGKTTTTIDERWLEHCRDSRKERCNKRPLYDAFNKYGIENFKIEELEYVQNNKLSDREIYWIQELQSYGKNGYNATKGGDGKILYDHSEILELYRLGYSTTQVSKKLNCSSSTVRKVLKANGVKSRRNSKIVDQFDLAGNYILTFGSTMEAADWLKDNNITTNKLASKEISACCNGKRKSIYGYKWSFKKIPE